VKIAKIAFDKATGDNREKEIAKAIVTIFS